MEIPVDNWSKFAELKGVKIIYTEGYIAKGLAVDDVSGEGNLIIVIPFASKGAAQKASERLERETELREKIEELLSQNTASQFWADRDAWIELTSKSVLNLIKEECPDLLEVQTEGILHNKLPHLYQDDADDVLALIKEELK